MGGGDADWIDLSIEVNRTDRMFEFVWFRQGRRSHNGALSTHTLRTRSICSSPAVGRPIEEFDYFDRLMRLHEELPAEVPGRPISD